MSRAIASCVGIEAVFLAVLRWVPFGQKSLFLRRAPSFGARGVPGRGRRIPTASPARSGQFYSATIRKLVAGCAPVDPFPGRVWPSSIQHLFVTGSHAQEGAQLRNLRRVGKRRSEPSEIAPSVRDLSRNSEAEVKQRAVPVVKEGGSRPTPPFSQALFLGSPPMHRIQRCPWTFA